jgi:hypothetical protein
MAYDEERLSCAGKRCTPTSEQGFWHPPYLPCLREEGMDGLSPESEVHLQHLAFSRVWALQDAGDNKT